MRLDELFGGEFVQDRDADTDEKHDSGSVMNGLRNTVMAMLTPLAANGVPYVTLQQLIDKLSQEGSGVTIDRNLLYTLIDPDKLRLVKSVEGDRVYLQLPTSANSDKEKNRKEDEIKKKEQQQRTTEKQSMQQTAKQAEPPKPVPPDNNTNPLSGL